MPFQEVDTRRRKEVESKHHSALKECTSEHMHFKVRLDCMKSSFPEKECMHGGYSYIHMHAQFIGGRSVLVVRQAGWLMKISLFTKFSKSCNLASNVYFQLMFVYFWD